MPLPGYSLNYNTLLPSYNDYKYSLSYGQMLNWNSALSQNQFSIDQIRRQGLVGFRLGNVNVSTNNDSKFYLGGSTDEGWTGGISVAVPFMEFGFQDFTGSFDAEGESEKRKKKYRDALDSVREDITLSKEERERKLEAINSEYSTWVRTELHTQSNYEISLNKASTYFRVNANDWSLLTLDLIGAAWFQNFIHNSINDLKFHYDYSGWDVWGGRNW